MEITSSLASAVSFLFKLVGLRKRREFDIQAKIIDRRIIAELPHEFPFSIVDQTGTKQNGIYVVGLVLWNRGTGPIEGNKFLQGKELRFHLGKDSKLAYFHLLPANEDTRFAGTIEDKDVLRVDFDCINPGEYLVIHMFHSGKPMTDVAVTGRIAGQSEDIDRTADEIKATIGERINAGLALAIVLFSLPALFIGAGLIYHNFGLKGFIDTTVPVPVYLRICFSVGFLFAVLAGSAALSRWIERFRLPDGFPLQSDFEPSTIDFIKGTARTLFRGEKHRLSNSIFDFGKPALVTRKNARRRSTKDWIK